MSKFWAVVCSIFFFFSVLLSSPNLAMAANPSCAGSIDTNGNQTYDCSSYCSEIFDNANPTSDFCNTPGYIDSSCLSSPGGLQITPLQCCKTLLGRDDALCSAPRNSPPCENNVDYSCRSSENSYGAYTYAPFECGNYACLGGWGCLSYAVAFSCYLPATTPSSSCGYVAEKQYCNSAGTAWVNAASNVCTAAASCAPSKSAPVCNVTPTLPPPTVTITQPPTITLTPPPTVTPTPTTAMIQGHFLDMNNTFVPRALNSAARTITIAGGLFSFSS